MKREFGTRLIETYFGHEVELTEVIDTSGAYIPGHGTPTVILIGRRRGGSNRSETIRTVRSVQGEPAVPESGESGLVWRAILDQIDTPASASQWVSVDDLERTRYFSKQPWVLSDGGLELNEAIQNSASAKLDSILPRDIGFASFPGQDDAFISTAQTLRRQQVPTEYSKTFITGENVRDWTAFSHESALVPYDHSLAALPFDSEAGWARLLWPARSCLRSTKDFNGKSQEDQGKPWWTWYRWVPDRYRTPLSILFASVATHAHFSLDRGGHVFNRHAPVIKLRSDASEEEHLQLLGLLNSSTAGFWLKMVSYPKGGDPLGDDGARVSIHPWSDRYEFAGTKVEKFPLPSAYPSTLATALDCSYSAG